MADHMAHDGFKDAGYQYVNIDVSFLGKSEILHLAFSLRIAGLLKRGISVEDCKLIQIDFLMESNTWQTM